MTMAKHPFEGLGMSKEDRIGFWEEYSSAYGTMHQGDMPGRIVSRLDELGMLKGDVIEIGSGPGTYSIPMARHASRVICLDSSEGMLRRLKASAGSEGLTNIETALGDWERHVPGSKTGLCISTLAPTSSPESLRRMESFSDGWCAIVSWIRNEGDDLTTGIWNALGKDFGFERGASPAEEWLRSNGRDPIVERFETHVSSSMPLDDLIEMKRCAFRAYGCEKDVGPIVKELTEPYTKDGIVRIEEDNSLRLLYWKIF